MSDSEKTKSSRWERIKNSLDQCAFLDICGHLVRVSAFASIIVGMFVYVWGCPDGKKMTILAVFVKVPQVFL